MNGCGDLRLEPYLAERGGVAQHDRAVHGVRRDRDEVRHELGILASVDAAEAGDAPAAMRMHVKDRGAVIHRPLAGAADGLGAHHGADARVAEILVIAHRPVFAGQNKKLIMRGGQARRR